ncbi:MAG: hypothetical protein JNN03_22665 [Rubrivivax sp.]|nr:hypothetical protein [Rubrivivax sp.]
MAVAHTVQDLEFEVEFESEEQAFSLQERLSEFAHGPALRIVAEAFDQACAEPDLLQLERLELDLGTVDPGDLEQQWEERLREQLQRALVDLVAAAGTPQAAGAAHAVRRGTVREAELEVLLHYLRRGVWPWHVSAAVDPAALAQRVWQNDPGALMARLREWPDGQIAARRMARQFPAAWCRQLAQELRADAAPGRETAALGSSAVATVEQLLLQALRTTAAPAAAGRATPEQRAARRRWRALLVDDAPELSNGDLDELMQVWQRLQHEDPDGLLQDLRTLGARAGVRRRMARLWPESLLRQLPLLWLGEEEGRKALAALEGTSADVSAGGRRQRWAALLRLLWAGPDVERIDAPALESAMRGKSERQPVAAPRASPGSGQASLPQPQAPLETDSARKEWQAWLSGASDVAGRLALREALSSAQRRWRLAPTITASEFARALAVWSPALEAEALAALAFAPLPQAWLRGVEPFPHTERLVHRTLQALQGAADTDWTAQGLVTRWWRAIAVQLQRSPDELLRALHEAGADGAEAARRSAWAHWLPQPKPRSARASAAVVSEALRHGDLASLQTAWSALLAEGAGAARAALGQLGDATAARTSLVRQLSGEQWLQLLEAFLAPGQARAVVRAQQVLQRALGDSPDLGEREAELRAWALAELLWHPGASADDVASHLLEQGARRAGLGADVLLRHLPREEQDLFVAQPEERAELHIAERTCPDAADEATTPRHLSQAEAVARVIAALRGAGASLDLDAGERALLMAMADRDSASVREVIARELESAQAGRLLARTLTPDELLRLVAWLRPADAAGLQQAWPRLQALTEGLGTQAWPRVARTVLREMCEEDRPLMPAALLQRAALAVRGSPRPPPPGWALELPDEPLFVANAGVVLLAPYLPRLFAVLGLANDKAFVDAEAAERAAAVMQYAVTGEAAAPEPLLPLNKLLCGLPLHTPLPRDVELGPSERGAVDGMLGAVIGHWKALGQTSVAGLRQTFLQREGRLEHKEEAWHLQVPSQTFDMLIDRLPWGFATVRYPWMPEVLHVQWR